MGTLDFSKFGLSNKSWKLVSMNPPPLQNGNFGFQHIWTQQQKLEIGFHNPRPPPPKMGAMDLSEFGLT